MMNFSASISIAKRHFFPLPVISPSPVEKQYISFEIKLQRILTSYTQREKAIAELVEQIEIYHNPEQQAEVIDVLRKFVDFYPYDVILLLGHLLKSNNSQLAWFATQELCRLAKVYAGPVARILEQLLKVMHRKVRSKAIYLLSIFVRLYNIQGLRLIELALISNYPDIQWAAASLLTELEQRFPQQVKQLIEKLRDHFYPICPEWLSLFKKAA